MEIQLGKSTIAAWWLAALLSGTATVVVILACWVSALWILCVFPLTVYGLRLWRWQVSRDGKKAVQSVHLGKKGHISVEFANNEKMTCHVDTRWLSPSWVLLSLRCKGSRWPMNLMIARDSMPPDQFRHLKVWLRTHQLGPEK